MMEPNCSIAILFLVKCRSFCILQRSLAIILCGNGGCGGLFAKQKIVWGFANSDHIMYKSHFIVQEIIINYIIFQGEYKRYISDEVELGFLRGNLWCLEGLILVGIPLFTGIRVYTIYAIYVANCSIDFLFSWKFAVFQDSLPKVDCN